MTNPTDEGPVQARRRSHSQFNSYAQCSERYRLQKIIRPRPPERPAAWLAHGNAFHETYQEWELSGRALDFKAHYFARYDKLVEEMKEVQPNLDLWMKPPRVRKVVEHIATQKIRGLDQVDNFLTMMDTADWWPYEDPDTCTPGVEIPFEIELGGIPLKGYIDLVREHEDGYSVLDFKTGNRIASIIQLGLYKLVVEEQLGITVTHGEYFYTKDCTLSPRYDLSRYTRDYLTEIYVSLNRGIQHEVFLPNPGDQCGMCPVFDFCREQGSRPVPLDWQSVIAPWWRDPNVPGALTEDKVV